jgi:hypothetical protein
VPSVQTPATSVHVTFDEPAFVAFTVPVAPTSSAVTDTLIVGVLSVVMLSILEAPVSLEESRSGTPIATGEVVSMMSDLLLPRELSVPGAASVSTALFWALSTIVPPFKLSDDVAT